MLLALDVGNTNITIGIFKNGGLADHRRLRTVREQTADEWGILLMNLLRYSSLDPAELEGIVISSVVPPLDSALAEMSSRYFGIGRYLSPRSPTPVSRFDTRILPKSGPTGL